MPSDLDAPNMDGVSLQTRDGASRSEIEQVSAIAISMFRSAFHHYPIQQEFSHDATDSNPHHKRQGPAF